jgi:hypothetical protein
MGGTAPLETHENGTGARKCAFLGHADMRNIFSKMSAAVPKHIIGKSGVWGEKTSCRLYCIEGLRAAAVE